MDIWTAPHARGFWRRRGGGALLLAR